MEPELHLIADIFARLTILTIGMVGFLTGVSFLRFHVRHRAHRQAVDKAWERAVANTPEGQTVDLVQAAQLISASSPERIPFADQSHAALRPLSETQKLVK